MSIILTGTQYDENFDGIISGLPSGWLVYTGANTTTVGTLGSWTTATVTWADTAGAFKNFAANDSGLTSNSSPSVQNSATDRALGIRQTGSFGDPGASFVLTLDNTIGFQNFGLSFKAQMLSVQDRSTTWTIDYRIGNSDSFNILGTYSDPGTFGSSTLNFSNFGTDINNQSNQVQIRISALSASTGSGSRDSFGIDDFQLTYTPVESNSNPPVVTLPGAATISYVENTGNQLENIILDANATVTDTDSPNFSAGKLIVRFTAGGTADDRLGIRNEGTGTSQINLDGKEIYYGSDKIASFSGGIGTENLVINLNANATPEATQALLRNITYTNTSQNPLTPNRTLEFILNDGSGGISTTVTKTIQVASNNDAPLVGTTTILYDGALGTLPQNQDLKYFGSGVTTISGGVTTLNTSADFNFQAGFSNYLGTTNSSSFVLDRTTGYTISFSAKVTDEARTTTANKNNDGKDDRAGFSVIAISSDGKYGIELGFWKDRIWAQDDGTTQKNPSLEPDTAPASNYRTLFTQAEGVSYTTTSLVSYDLTVLGDTYTLFANGNAILSGKLRDYSAVPNGLLDVYENPNFIFFGDNTPSARANIDLGKVAVTTYDTLSAVSVNEDESFVIPNLRIDDVDAGSSDISVTLLASQGNLTLNSTVSGGVTAGNIINNGTNNVTLTGTLSQINTTLAATNGLVYKGNQDFFGNDTLSITATDGVTPSTPKAISINVNPINDAPTFSIGGNQSVRAISGQIVTRTIQGWAYNFNPGVNETQTNTGYMVSLVNPSDSSFFTETPTINTNGDLTYTLASNITGNGSKTIDFQVQAGDSEGGISQAKTFKITVTSGAINFVTTNPTNNNIALPTPNPDILMGTDGSDRIDGLAGDDTIYGGLGNDRIIGGAGNDILYGDLPNMPSYALVNGFTFDDIIQGNAGDDTIYGGWGNDTLYGNDGNDTIWGGAGNDTIWGGAGNDTFVLNATDQGTDTIQDFTLGEDIFGCAGGWGYASLTFTQQGSDTLIKAGNLNLAIVKNMTVSNLDKSANFLSI
ncbi:hypothetical protein [Calothrix sp. UHCC 0171]|uniref:choice-of-anchor Y domain-containing protein n=1 Tax=Calothrix sp. UHCC 0171 TaxID=3110245 RepID=UPI002B2145AA|nr:hypothetical protein [Calothrix sp. UHCC 0171]MEA5570965.1 hypothetical protein [Calothrix sp. UHCC 0171]